VTAWRDLVDRAVVEVGPVTPALARHWRTELDDVERRVTALERSAPATSRDDGLHAFVALASARVGEGWDSLELVDVAAAVELAFRATCHHRVVANAAMPDGRGLPRSRSRPGTNTGVVLDGDWSITQAAVLVADVGPDAYRMLVRAYGATQVGELSGDAGTPELLRAAVSLGVMVAGSPAAAAEAIWTEASTPSPVGRRSAPAAVLAWAVESVTGQSPGTSNARSVAVTAPVGVQSPSKSMTTRPAVGRS
jgi:hypothetical protein